MKERFWIFYLFLFGWLPWASGVEIMGHPRVIHESATQVRIKWSTDTEAGARVRYGLNEASMQSVKGDSVGTSHEILLQDLQPGKKYYFSIGTAKKVLRTGSFEMPVTAKQLTQEGSKERSNAPPAKDSSKQPSSDEKIPAARFTWNRWDTLQDHFDRHGPDFGSKSPEDYADDAHRFLRRGIREGLPAKYDDSQDTLRVFDPKTREFAAYTRKGKTRTYFKPNSPTYFERQPGRPIDLKTLLKPR